MVSKFVSNTIFEKRKARKISAARRNFSAQLPRTAKAQSFRPPRIARSTISKVEISEFEPFESATSGHQRLSAAIVEATSAYGSRRDHGRTAYDIGEEGEVRR